MRQAEILSRHAFTHRKRVNAGKNLMNKIPNSQLIENDIPHLHASWKKIEPFAVTFDGYKHWGSFKKCREVAEEGVKLYRGQKDLTQSLTDLARLPLL
jgi:hypothetical protein